MNKVTFKSWCHPLLAVSALCLLSGAPDPPQRWWEPWRSACTICTESHSLTWHGTLALPKCVSVMPADWWPLVLSLNPAWLAPKGPMSPLDLLPIACCPKHFLPELGSAVLPYSLLYVLSPTQQTRRAILIPLLSEHMRSTGRPPGRMCWQIWVPGGVGFCF